MRFGLVDFLPPIFVRLVRKAVRVAARKQSEARTVVHPPARNLPIQPYASLALGSSSQFHEDLLIDLLFLGKTNGFYVDVGANDPAFNSNTKRFYDKGWHGINIEPGPDAFENLSAHRPHDINLNIGVAPSNGDMMFYQVIGDSTLSSFNKSAAEKMAATYGLSIAELKVRVLRLESIFEEYVHESRVDFMSVDAEGFDLEVLESNNWNRYRPSLLLIEIDKNYEKIVAYMRSCNYQLVFNNLHNGLFVDERTSCNELRYLVDIPSLHYPEIISRVAPMADRSRKPLGRGT